MKLHELKPAEGSRQVRNRVGRGTSSGNGKTAGRGQKGKKPVQAVVFLGFEGVKLHYSVVYQNVGLQTLIVKITLL